MYRYNISQLFVQLAWLYRKSFYLDFIATIKFHYLIDSAGNQTWAFDLDEKSDVKTTDRSSRSVRAISILNLGY